MKAMGIDFGLKRIGVAFSDETKFLATPYEVYVRQNNTQDIQHFVDLIEKNKVDEIVCGLPMNMQGNEQEIAELTRSFMDELQAKVLLKLVLLTSVCHRFWQKMCLNNQKKIGKNANKNLTQLPHQSYCKIIWII